MTPVGSFELDEVKQTWRAPWYFFCGNCTPSDCASCCTAYWLPCVAYGYTTSKVFRTSFWREAGRFLLFFGIIGVVGFIWALTAVIMCPVDPNKDIDPASQSGTCAALNLAAQLIRGISFGCAVCWAWYVGGPRRTQLRKLVGISDTGAGGDCCTCCYARSERGAANDRCLHFWCLWCALAQEMRTVKALAAADKLPKAPPEGYQPLLPQAPDMAEGMSRDKAGDAMV